MPHKTYDQPPPVYALFMKHSVAHVIAGEPTNALRRALTRRDVLRAHAQKYAHNR